MAKEKRRPGQKYEIVWVRAGLLNCKDILCGGSYKPLVMPKTVKVIVDKIIKKGYPYYVYFMGNCEIITDEIGQKTSTCPKAHCAWYNHNGCGDCEI
jgi:hypothetical protein